jgi:hypothetical protein
MLHCACGVANYNLISLSSVIPTQSVIQRAKYDAHHEYDIGCTVGAPRRTGCLDGLGGLDTKNKSQAWFVCRLGTSRSDRA